MARGVITERQRDHALELQRQTKELLGAVLVRRGWVSEDQMCEALAVQFGLARVRVTPASVDWTAADHLPVSVMARGTCFPIRHDRASLTVAIADPLNAWLASEVEREARGRRVQWVLATTEEITEAIRQYQSRQAAPPKDAGRAGGGTCGC